MKHKYMIIVEAPYVKADTEKLLREIARRYKAEFLGGRKLKSGDYQCGLSCTDKTFSKVAKAVSLTNNGNCLVRDYGEDDGKRKSKQTDASKKEPKDVPCGTKERIPPILPIEGQFGKWSDLGSDEHKRAIAILGANCENAVMKQWGKFSIDRVVLWRYIVRALENVNDAEFLRLKNMIGEYALKCYNPTWKELSPWVAKVFSKKDAAFIEWHTTHSGRRPADV